MIMHLLVSHIYPQLQNMDLKHKVRLGEIYFRNMDSILKKVVRFRN
nr:MAG TPA: hypothetical protein [Caudoviricetes sp.]